MGPWLAETIRQCDGFVQEMSYWTFSDVFEEQGVVKKPFWGGFGLIAAGGIPKPAFNAFALLHRLGERRLANDTPATLVTRQGDGALVIALWNYAEVGTTAPMRSIALRFTHSAARSASVQSIDRVRGNVNVAYERMGSPRYPTQRELAQLREAAALPAPITRPLQSGELDLQIPSDGLVLVTVDGNP
jgi:xylan 1,4-beta-xylosidase